MDGWRKPLNNRLRFWGLLVSILSLGAPGLACNYPARVDETIARQEFQATLTALAPPAEATVTPDPADLVPDPQPPSAGLPTVVPDTLPENWLFPDGEVVYSPATVDFSVDDFIQQAGGYLSTYREQVDGIELSGAGIIQKVAVENSINPRLLLAVLEYRSGWVRGQPADPARRDHPIGFYVPNYAGLYKELVLTATQLGVGYYGWRDGSLAYLKHPDGSLYQVDPELNAGSAALQVLFSRLENRAAWQAALFTPGEFLDLYRSMFGDPTVLAAGAEPVVPAGLSQPVLELPFAPGERWSFTGGPHRSWNAGSPRGALDFSPANGEPACRASSAWVTASASGRVARSSDEVVAVDLDGDGFEGTGWVLVYLHIPERERVPAGAWVEVDDQIGHPSCEGGSSTGTHVHLARKYNGEWIPADGGLPFVLSGWEVHGGSKSFEGYLIRGDQVITANPGGSRISIIVR